MLSNRYSTTVYHYHSERIDNDSIPVNLSRQKRFCTDCRISRIDLTCVKQRKCSAENVPCMYINIYIYIYIYIEQELSIRWRSRRQFDFARVIRLYEIGTALDSFNCDKFNDRYRFAIRIMQFTVGIFTLLHIRSRYIHAIYTWNILRISLLSNLHILLHLSAANSWQGFHSSSACRIGRIVSREKRLAWCQKQIKRTPPDLRGRIPQD